ncbi:MAG TPA: LeoA/HP0731 family dynamin-like GTPase [Candidatus Binatia bacterium]|nr:LeoA/HP0731 family dynamin-like GTPase [Candidatus Binatia bacterium]
MKISEQATKEISGVPGSVAGQSGMFFIRATEAGGSSLHQTIYQAGKFVGFQFKPWQAVNWSKITGNVTRVAGPILAVVAVVLDGVDAYQEAQNERQLAQWRREIDSKFLAIARDFEEQFEKKWTEIEKELYESIEQKIYEAHISKKEEIARTQREVQEVLNIRSKLENLSFEPPSYPCLLGLSNRLYGTSWSSMSPCVFLPHGRADLGRDPG